jgi:Alpha/beta hydrolase of unknown function (DUF900)
MPNLSGFPYVEAEFDPDGVLNPPTQDEAISDTVNTGNLTDLIVISHGWNNDKEEAQDLYARMFEQVRSTLPQAPLANDRRLGILGILWPSKKFTDRELIPGGGSASLDGSLDDAGDVSTTHLEREVDRFKAVAKPGPRDLDEMKTLLDRLEDDPSARKRFVELVHLSLDPPAPAPVRGQPSPEASASAFDPKNTEDIFSALRAPILEQPGQSDLGGAASIGDEEPQGGAAGIGSIFDTAKAAAERMLNVATYYQMKERAAKVGSSGVANLLRKLRQKNPTLRIHLVGHSFGARLVTAAADACGKEVQPASMTLLQAAFSHNSFAPPFESDGTNYTGFFRSVVQDGKIAGPIVITHTVNDKAVGLAYALASRLAREAASRLGDENDLYGGLGRNGAVHMPETELGGQSLEMLAPGGNYTFAKGRVFNLKSDSFIDGHSEICNQAVAYALLKAIA